MGQNQDSDNKPYLTYDSVIKKITKKSYQYHSIELKLDVVTQVFIILSLGLMFQMELSNKINDLSPFTSEYSFLSVLWTLSWYIIIINLITLPFTIYSEIIERRFEFSTRTNKKWVIDTLKSLILSLIFLNIIVEAIFFVLYKFEDTWWIYGIFISLTFLILYSFLSPLILSIFTKVEPMPPTSLKTKLENLTNKMNLKYKDIFVWKMSNQTNKVNAAVTGFGSSTKIVIGDTLINDFRDDEIEMVLAHEIAHHKNKDIYRSIIFFTFNIAIMLYIIELGFEFVIRNYNLSSKSDPAAIGYLAFSSYFILILFESSQLFYSRKREKAADIVAIRTIPNIELYESTFARLSEKNLVYPYPSRLEIFIRYSHPPVKDRIEYGKNEIIKINGRLL